MDKNLWDRFAVNCLEDLLPFVIDSDTPIDPASTIHQLGKVPSIVGANGAKGIHGWPRAITTKDDIERYKKDPRLGIMLNCRTFKSITVSGKSAACLQARDSINYSLKSKTVSGSRTAGKTHSFRMLIRVDEDIKFSAHSEDFEVEIAGDGQCVILAGGPYGLEWSSHIQTDLGDLPVFKKRKVIKAMENLINRNPGLRSGLAR